MSSDPLGSTTKFASASLENDPLVRRYYLQSLARELLPDERISVCMRVIKVGRNTVDILHNSATKKARYRGLMRCASIWNCPVCAAFITEQRRVELAGALERTDYAVAMVTYTIRHNRKETLRGLLKILKTAYDRMKSGRASVEVRAEYGWIGSVRALEVTHGENGWHPHLHELVLFDDMNANLARSLEITMRDRWIDMVEQVGGSANRENGLSVKFGDKDISEYVEKFGRLPKDSSWNVTHELTKAPTKRGRLKGRTPYELLIDYGAGDKQSGALFVEYAYAFKHSSQLQWSRGLRALLGLTDEKPDSDLIEGEESGVGVILATLERAHWKLVTEAGKRAQLLKIASSGEETLVWEFIYELEAEQERTKAL